ncbi:50S ribosomal protein L13 [Halarcobacter ebronensis]|uniref:Large ribosomal subunit protein uL13 n=1 Tax=Halarcobacter ebronensis TaxID=1462615 RepID=A0A4V1M0W7_9BACT|nr:50S ribosomal protein L13 [Halarcobacter ebronensis]QKF80800.1 50S ribosomal protein L13 [Halarcobacter ebronensis]RXJ67988.1 50S ribosomal protein L13 [Halarcobacter ebronensis]RXK08590.1 50S ribosomal protein L13 [Halarcobacter ebronensis]
MKFTQMAKANEIERDWIVVDATDKIFGRIITEVATLLKGKHKPSYTPHVDCGDNVIIINASKAKFSGTKLENKNYYTHSGYFGSTKTHKMAEMLDKNPEKLYKLATRGMLPKTKLGKEMLKKLKVYAGSEHPHSAQIKG